MQTVIIVIHLMVVTAMIGVVLLQKSEGGGLGIGSTGGFLSSRGTCECAHPHHRNPRRHVFRHQPGAVDPGGSGTASRGRSSRTPAHPRSRYPVHRSGRAAAACSIRCANRSSRPRRRRVHKCRGRNEGSYRGRVTGPFTLGAMRTANGKLRTHIKMSRPSHSELIRISRYACCAWVSSRKPDLGSRRIGAAAAKG